MNKFIIVCGLIIGCAIGFIIGDEVMVRIRRSQIPPIHEYQIDLEMDSVKVWDNNRFVGIVPYNKIDSLLIEDNR